MLFGGVVPTFVSLLREFGSGGLARADGPDGFVSYDDAFPVLSLEALSQRLRSPGSYERRRVCA